MKLTHLHLENFRNYDRLDFTFPDEPILVLNGKNAQGKTSFLEAIYLLALTKSFRTSDTEFLKQLGKNYFRITGKGHDTQFEIGELLDQSKSISKRTLKKNGVRMASHDFIGHLKVVLFRPEDLMMLTGEPALRRKYLNHVLIQTAPGYLKQLQIYQKLLSQRNALLLQIKQNFASPSAFDPWDKQLSEAGSALLTSRIEFITFVQNFLKNQLKIDYTSSIFHNLNLSPGRDSASKNEKFDNKRVKNNISIQEAMLKSRQRDIASGHTSVGPHRDDIKLKIKKGGKNATPTPGSDVTSTAPEFYPIELASRGELRTCMIALKAAEIAWIEHETGETPLILLDDIFSELDTTHKTALFENLLLPLAEKTQIIMTIAEGNTLPEGIIFPKGITAVHGISKLKSASAVRKIHAGQIGKITEAQLTQL